MQIKVGALFWARDNASDEYVAEQELHAFLGSHAAGAQDKDTGQDLGNWTEPSFWKSSS